MASKGVYITHEEVDALLDQEGADDAQPHALASDLLDTTIADKITASAKRGIFLSLPWVAQLFSLSPVRSANPHHVFSSGTAPQVRYALCLSSR